MADPKKQPVQKAQKETMDNPEQYPTDNKSLFDRFFRGRASPYIYVWG